MVLLLPVFELILIVILVVCVPGWRQDQLGNVDVANALTGKSILCVQEATHGLRLQEISEAATQEVEVLDVAAIYFAELTANSLFESWKHGWHSMLEE